MVRDVFVFCCHTGVAYIDVKQLTHDNLIKGIDGNLWLRIYREKTQTPSIVPLSIHAKYLISKYNPKAGSKDLVFPVFSNQTMNRTLKKVGFISGIERTSLHMLLDIHLLLIL